jgi:hypothetical protein
MCRTNRDPLLRFGIQPAARNLTAGEHDLMRPVGVDDGEYKIPLKWCCRYRLPHDAYIRRLNGQRIDLDHRRSGQRRELW